jgi:hypothetical protein
VGPHLVVVLRYREDVHLFLGLAARVLLIAFYKGTLTQKTER